jgi:hypothetical protein
MSRLTLLTNEWERPSENIHKIRQPVRVWCAIELTNAIHQLCLKFNMVSLLHDIRLVLQHSGLVGVYVQVIRGREDGHDGWETCRLGFTVHSISIISPRISKERLEESTHPAS